MKQFLLLALLAIVSFLACDDQRPQADIDDEIIRNYLKEKNITAERHSSGIYYVIQTPGTGDNPVANSVVKVKYKGYFLDGTIFDETTGNQTVDESLQGFIPGWQIAVPLLKAGGKGTFYIPSGWAYGRFPPAGIPENAILIFDIELISFR